ncbi:hypothetical protein ACS0TY_036964 [Phlomoides rotata]
MVCLGLQIQFRNLAILVIILASPSSLAAITPPNLSISKPNCPDHCGNVTIPFPFGTSQDCYLNYQFFVNCSQSSNPPEAFLANSTIPITDISLDGQLTIMKYIAYDCHGRKPGGFNNRMTAGAFTVNNIANKFTVVGCDTYAYVYGRRYPDRYYQAGCMAVCRNTSDLEAGDCTGSGCCQTSFPKDVWGITLLLKSFYNYTNVSDFNDCGFAFVAKESAFNFTQGSLTELKKVEKLPMVLDWDIGNGTDCDEAKMEPLTYACKSVNSECYVPDSGNGYRCSCKEGYQGNPYLDGGCEDINECEEGKNECEEQRCVNTPGNYMCECPKGYRGDRKEKGRANCSRSESLVFKIVSVVALGVIVVLLSACWLHLEFNRRRNIKMRLQFFLQNGGLLLQEKLIGRQSSSNAARIFSASELQKATNNFHNSMIIGQGGHGTVYKGVLPDDHKVIAIKKSKKVDPNEIDQFINEVVVLSQINHRNVVKLLGCCLETEAPLLVYEFISNGTLFEHVHNKAVSLALSWDMRLRIATETAGVLSYLHSAASTPIIHRDVKTANILLDHTYTAKVADFGASRLVPLDDSQLSTFVQGTFGYLDPEYLQSRQLTEKSDVYSFGVVLMELLTGRKALIKDGPEEEKCLANFFLKVMKEQELFQVVEDNLMRERDRGVVMKVAVLAKRCVNVRGENRPFMKEVAMELEGLRVGGKHSWIQTDRVANDEESLFSKGFSGSFMDGEGYNTCSTSGGFDSIKGHMIPPVDGGR